MPVFVFLTELSLCIPEPVEHLRSRPVNSLGKESCIECTILNNAISCIQEFIEYKAAFFKNKLYKLSLVIQECVRHAGQDFRNSVNIGASTLTRKI